MILRIWQEKLVIVTSVLSENGIESLFFLVSMVCYLLQWSLS